MDHYDENIKSGCQKILDKINSMSLVNLDDQQVHSLVMMREIARGVVADRERKVTKSDVISSLRYSIEKMVGASRDIIEILSRMSYEGLDDQRVQSVLRMKEIAHGIIDKQAKVATTRQDDKLGEQVRNSDDGTMDSLVLEATEISNGSIQIEELQGMMHEDDILLLEPVSSQDYGQNELYDSLLPSAPLHALVWPPNDCITLEWVQDMMFTLEQSSWKMLPSDFQRVIPTVLVDRLTDAARSILCTEQNCVEIDCQGEDTRVIVVGDIRGHFHDLLSLFKHAGVPSENQYYVFNGNYVDKGSWGVEVFLVLLAWKVLMPHRVYLLRGNHESKYCTSRYGFNKEVQTKYSDEGEYVYSKFLDCFKELPLASVIAGCVYTTHGGLFRSINVSPSHMSKRKKTRSVELGSLAELAEVKRSFVDAPSEGPNILLTDVLWSRPSKKDGLRDNADQKLGLWWGPDCTEAFLKQSNLKLIIRSHDGPDTRASCHDFGDMLSGYSVDHVGESGKLYTLFSVPEYPQYGERRYSNEGAYAILSPPDFASPSIYSFTAVERPRVDPYVNGDAEEEIDLGDPGSTQVHAHASTSAISPPQRSYPVGMSPGFDFGALGIYNAPSWSVQLPDDAGGTQVVQVPRAPVVEGLPLPPNIQEPHKAAYEYLFELVASLKHMLITRETENRARISALRNRGKKRKGKRNS
ncbi:Serine/threonine-protein phosphatase [Quillaja saponaria]|uniref:Serine/threonine-protein phosphatase n=1 Tax=Quillaja saponaria TaxID=32244 RepID=A0AAD7VKS2_QUISA|nr:Serine/threonine-protein phosphatase [Quillaja saponaria]